MAEPTGVRFGVLAAQSVLDQAAEIESLSFDSIWVSEHILFHGPTLEALTTLAAVAGRTSRISLGTAVYLMPLRHPTITAKTAGTLDIISGGRLILGIGVGGEYKPEFDATGVPVKQRGARTDEAIDICRRLWTEEHVDYEGRHFSLGDVSMKPRPASPPPIWIAGRSKAAMRRAAIHGDGYLPYLVDPARYRQGLSEVHAEAEKAGRDPAQITPALYQFIYLSDSYEEARRVAVEDLSRRYNQSFEGIAERYSVLGNADQCVERLQEFIDAGVRHFVLTPLDRGNALEQYRAYANDLLPRLR
ncbi:MAG: LLM class flavin-dependent oxidoreductase [Dehalococcoidia bacterium]|nr:LLM class flavin-dependent oxidoreductase [Dehalococcoidia bacterium]